MDDKVISRPQEPAGPDSERIEELDQLKKAVTEHGVRILVGISIGLLIAGSVSFYRINKRSKMETASKLLGAAKSAQDLEAVISRYPESPSAPLALLKIAKLYYNNESFDVAIQKYSEFKEKYPEHQMVLSADMGIAHCNEAKGFTERALWAYTSFLNEHPRHFLASQAILGKARCLELLGRPGEAKEIYEEFIARTPESEWAPLVEEKLAEVKDVKP